MLDEKKLCERCTWFYPSNLLHPYEDSFQSKIEVCGICALEMINEVDGTDWDSFEGDSAEQYRRAAIAYRKQHPEDAP
jgi:hypothetical protein